MVKANHLSYNPCTLLNMPNSTAVGREPFDSQDMRDFFQIFTNCKYASTWTSVRMLTWTKVFKKYSYSHSNIAVQID